MKVIYLDDYITIEDELALAIGYFDGFHLGHQKLVEEVIEVSNNKGYKKALMTFDHHPSYILNLVESEYYLLSLNDKIKMVEDYGFDYLFIVPFTKMVAKLEPETFIDEYLKSINVKYVVCGFDFNFGNLAKGSANTLKEHFELNVVDAVKLDNQKVSTTAIKQLLRQGNIEKAEEFLSRPYVIKGNVKKGRQLGRSIGFPTANINFKNYVLPKRGVYACIVMLGGTRYYGMCNNGKNPTVTDLVSPSLEVHLFDFDDNIYDQTLEIQLCHFIRDEQKFSSIDELKKQLTMDKEEVLKFFYKK